MEWLSPLVGLYAAAGAVPLLLLLYFLKLKRREVIVSSTLLWKRAVQDLQVNAPFQRLRRNLLLLLQLLALAAVLVALAGPVLAWRQGPGQRYVVLIDRSASMNATDVKPSRLDAAKEQAKVFIESMRSGSALSLRDGSDHAMVIAFDQHAKVMCNFTSDKRQLLAALDAIEPSDGPSRLGEVVTVARAFAQSPSTEGNIRSAETPARLVLFSDGRIQDLDTVVVAPDELVFHRIGAVAGQRRRHRHECAEVLRAAGAGGGLRLSGELRGGAGDARCPACHRRQRPGRPIRHGSRPPGSGRRGAASNRGRWPSISPCPTREAGVLEVRQLGADALARDDAAWSILEPPKRLSVLLVTNGNPVLESALQACPLARLDPCTPAGFEALDPAVFTVQQRYDVVVLDNYVPAAAAAVPLSHLWAAAGQDRRQQSARAGQPGDRRLAVPASGAAVRESDESLCPQVPQAGAAARRRGAGGVQRVAGAGPGAAAGQHAICWPASTSCRATGRSSRALSCSATTP